MERIQIANNIFKSLDNSEFKVHLYNKLINSFNKQSFQPGNDIFSNIEEEILKDSELNEEFNNFIFSESFKFINNPKLLTNSVKDADNYLFQAQVSWEKRILKSINSMCMEFQIPLVKKRTDKEMKEIREKWTELSTLTKDLKTSDTFEETGSIRPVYAPKDFLEVLIKLKIGNCKISPPTSSEHNNWLFNWGLLQIPLRIKSIQELRIQFSELAIGQQQIGVDDIDKINIPFENERQNLAKIILESRNAAACQEFAKSGCQLENRRKIWYTIFNINITQSNEICPSQNIKSIVCLDNIEKEFSSFPLLYYVLSANTYNYYNQLKQNVFEYDLLIDSLLFMEVKLTATNDDTYFVFEDYLYQILLPFSRDTSLLKVFEASTASPAKISVRVKSSNDQSSIFYPPSGILPFHGFSMLVVPMCYFIDDPVELYVMFKEMYSRYFHKLHSISDDPQGILSLCVLFEATLQSLEPELFFYLRSVGIQPIRLAFKWIMRGFSGFLAADQVLLLWDRIVGYESLEMLSLVAIAILSFRKSNLMNVKTQTAAEAVLADLTTVQVIPLLQLALFSR